MIYPFKRIEKEYKTLELTSRFEIIQDIFPEVKKEEICEFSGDLEKYSAIYGKEACIWALLSQPIYRRVELNHALVFSGWKMMNKIWMTLNMHCIGEKNLSLQDSEKLQSYFDWAKRSYNPKKIHTYLSCIIHIINFFKKKEPSLEDLILLQDFIRPILKCMLQEVKNQAIQVF